MKYFVYGGTAPYHLDNTAPDAMIFDRDTVSNRGDGFTVTTTNVCVNPATINITDHLGHLITATLVNGSSSGP